MIDKSKRKTLKALAATATAGVATSLNAGAAKPSLPVETRPGRGIDPATGNPATGNEVQRDLGQIEVSRRVSATHNDLEIVITNTGDQTVIITDMTPGTLSLARGEFNFSALLDKGPLHLDSTESVSVPLQRTTIASNRLRRTSTHALQGSLTDSLRNSMSIVTDSNAFASVTILEPSVA